jgi:hypothetical protein
MYWNDVKSRKHLLKMKLITTSTIDPDRWDQFVSRHPLGAIYHHSAWQEAISKTYGYEPLFHLIQDDSSNILAGISSAYVRSWITGNRIVSYPFWDTCDALVGSADELDTLVAALHRSREEIGASFFELRLAEAQCFYGNNCIQMEYLNHVLPLDKKPEELFRSFHKSSIQRAIKKAEREELEILPGKGIEDLRHFYRLHLLTRKSRVCRSSPFAFSPTCGTLLYIETWLLCSWHATRANVSPALSSCGLSAPPITNLGHPMTIFSRLSGELFYRDLA